MDGQQRTDGLMDKNGWTDVQQWMNGMTDVQQQWMTNTQMDGVFLSIT